jgi:hypothetical protein
MYSCTGGQVHFDTVGAFFVQTLAERRFCIV